MHLTCTALDSSAAAATSAYTLYRSTFPPEEQLPWEMMQHACKAGAFCMDAFYAAEDFAGIAFYAATPHTIYLLYLAVNESMRGRGVGSAIIAQVQSRRPEASMVLEIEPLDPAAENYPQRVSRLAFYQRNGFSLTPYDIEEEGEVYTVLATGESFNVQRFQQVIDLLAPSGYAAILLKAR